MLASAAIKSRIKTTEVKRYTYSLTKSWTDKRTNRLRTNSYNPLVPDKFLLVFKKTKLFLKLFRFLIKNSIGRLKNGQREQPQSCIGR